jgi:hypothetical protein
MRAGVFSAAVPPRQEPGVHLVSCKHILLQTHMQVVLKVKINSLFVSCTRGFRDCAAHKNRAFSSKRIILEPRCRLYSKEKSICCVRAGVFSAGRAAWRGTKTRRASSSRPRRRMGRCSHSPRRRTGSPAPSEASCSNHLESEVGLITERFELFLFSK